MITKQTTSYICESCGNEYPDTLGAEMCEAECSDKDTKIVVSFGLRLIYMDPMYLSEKEIQEAFAEKLNEHLVTCGVIIK